MELKDTYNKIAEDWHKDHHNDDWWAKGTDNLISLLPPHASILDIGCGAGHKTSYLAKKGLDVTGADFSEAMINIAQREIPNVPFQVLDIYHIDSVGKTFDCVFAQAVLLHIPKKDVVEILQKTKKVLNKDGLLYLAVKEARPGSPDERIETESDYGYTYERFFSYFTTPELLSYLSQAGFEVVTSDIVDLGHTRWIQVIARNQ